MSGVNTGRGGVPAAVGHGRFVVMRDRNGVRTAVQRHAVSAACEGPDGGTTLLLPGGRLVQLDEDLDLVLAWLA